VILPPDEAEAGAKVVPRWAVLGSRCLQKGGWRLQGRGASRGSLGGGPSANKSCPMIPMACIGTRPALGPRPALGQQLALGRGLGTETPGLRYLFRIAHVPRVFQRTEVWIVGKSAKLAAGCPEGLWGGNCGHVSRCCPVALQQCPCSQKPEGLPAANMRARSQPCRFPSTAYRTFGVHVRHFWVVANCQALAEGQPSLRVVRPRAVDVQSGRDKVISLAAAAAAAAGAAPAGDNPSGSPPADPGYLLSAPQQE